MKKITLIAISIVVLNGSCKKDEIPFPENTCKFVRLEENRSTGSTLSDYAYKTTEAVEYTNNRLLGRYSLQNSSPFISSRTFSSDALGTTEYTTKYRYIDCQ
jgi:hypothetical protein